MHATLTEKLNTLARFCAYQERCKVDILQKMFDIGVLPEERELLIHSLEKEGFFSEERFADAFVRGKFRINQWGKRKISAALSQKGIPPAMIQKSLLEIDASEYLYTAQQLASKQLLKIKAKNKLEKKQKLFHFLLQRGFEMDIIQEINLDSLEQ